MNALGVLSVLLPGAVRHRPGCCVRCGTELDPPRVFPLTGRVARRCPECREWTALGSEQVSAYDE